MELKDQQNMRQLAPQFVQKDEDGKVKGYDADGYYNALMGAGVAPPKIMAMRSQQAEMTKNFAQAGTAQLDLQGKKNDQAYQVLEGVRSVAKSAKDPTEVQNAYQQAVPRLQQLGVDTSKFPPQLQNPDESISQFEAGLGVHKQIIEDAKTLAQTNESAAKGANEQAEAGLNQNKLAMIQAAKQNPQAFIDQVDKVAPGATNRALNMRTKAQVQLALQNGDIEGAKTAISKASEQVGSIEKDVASATNPAIQAAKLHLATATKAAEQAIADGDPVAAGKLLHDGVVSPSQIISARKPEFAQKAFSAAAGFGDGWNAQKAEADFKVASSPTNVSFFGSAKSLTDKGGTLDQLKDAAKDIPDGKIPVFNNIADVMRAATGSGPIAKYSSILLGMADDYSKVMGGGQGSDTSRTQALSLVPAKASPEARSSAIEGIRGAVGSQISSRIGNNAVLKKMYGDDLGKPSNPAKPTDADPFAAFGGKSR